MVIQDINVNVVIQDINVNWVIQGINVNVVIQDINVNVVIQGINVNILSNAFCKYNDRCLISFVLGVFSIEYIRHLAPDTQEMQRMQGEMMGRAGWRGAGPDMLFYLHSIFETKHNYTVI